AHTYIGMSQAIGGATVAVAIELEAGALEHAVEQLDVVAGKDVIGRFLQLLRRGRRLIAPFSTPEQSLPPALGRHGFRAVAQALIGPHRARHAFAKADAALAAHFNFKNLLA